MVNVKTINVEEAPDEYYAVLKSEAKPADGSNICRACDWRKVCQNPSTDFTIHNHRCMSYTVILPDGKEVTRHDGCSVVFKKK